MSNAMIILNEKIAAQNEAAATLKEDFKAAIHKSMNVTSLKIDEVQYFGMKVFREIVAELRRNEGIANAEMETREEAVKRWKKEWEDEQKKLAPEQANPADMTMAQ